MKNKKVVILIGIVVVILIVLFFDKTKNSGAFEIGLIAPLSGDLAYFGEDFKNGAELAVQEINETGGNFKIIIEDSQFDPKVAVSAYQKMNLTNNLETVVVFGNGSDEAILPVAEKNEDVVISTFSTASGFPSKSDLAFRYFTNADTDAPVVAKYAVENLKLKKIAILYVQDSFGIDYKNVFSDKFKSAGGQVVASEVIQYTENSYRTEILKLIKNNPEAIYIVAQDYQVVTAIKETKELGYKGKIISVGTIATNRSITQAQGLLEGVYTTAFCTDGTPEEFREKFIKKYNFEPGFMAELGYDTVRIISEASKEGTVQNSKKISKNLSSIKDFMTNQGKVSSDSEGEIIIPVCPKVIKDDKIFNLVTKQYSNY
jgi:branched-chain amino acid transport system substrate-binding protein